MADEFETWIAQVALGSVYPAVGYWPYPDAKQGALISSHQSRSLAGRPLWMSIHERELGGRTTTFIASPDPEVAPPELTDPEYVGHAALLWVLDPERAGLQHRWGVFGLSPLRQPLNLDEQLSYLTLGLGDVDTETIHGVRTWSGRWSEHYTLAYRAMERHGFRYSVSYVPGANAPPGYVFGTCQPFRPVDTNGFPFSLREVPVCFVDPSTEDEFQLLGAALRRSSERANSLHVLTSSDRFSDEPDLQQFDGWRDMLNFARRNDMWIGGAGQITSFWSSRNRSSLRTVARTVSERADDGSPLDLTLVIECEAAGRDMSIYAPINVGSLVLQEAQRGLPGNEQSGASEEYEPQNYRGHEVLVIPVGTGFSALTLRYRVEEG